MARVALLTGVGSVSAATAASAAAIAGSPGTRPAAAVKSARAAPAFPRLCYTTPRRYSAFVLDGSISISSAMLSSSPFRPFVGVARLAALALQRITNYQPQSLQFKESGSGLTCASALLVNLGFSVGWGPQAG